MGNRIKRFLKEDTFNKIGVFSASIFVTSLAVYVLAPIVGSHADTSKTAEVSLTIGSASALRVSAESLNLVANIGSFAHDSLDVDVTTNSQYGYTLTLEDTDSDSNLVHVNPSVTDNLTSKFSGGKTSSDMQVNTWGFSLDETNYYHIPAVGYPTTLKKTSAAVSDEYDRTSVDFGAKVGNITSGVYTDTVKFTLYVNGVDNNPDDGTDPSEPGTANDFTPVGIHSITKMQEMTSEICAASTTPSKKATMLDWDGSRHGNNSYVPRTKLIDERDNKTYLVSKLADGNCWMSQNLALDLTEGVPIIISNNDGTTGTATPNITTKTAVDPNWRAGGSYTWKSYSGKDYGTYYFENGNTLTTTHSNTGTQYDWEINGNYYTWFAATAGTGDSSISYADAPSSICPAGWRLPANIGEKSFENLITDVYGFVYGESDGTLFRKDPFNYIYAGYYSGSGGTSLAFLRQAGYYWSSMADYSYRGNSFRFTMNDSYFSPHDTYSKDNGCSIRCVAL